jgi:hypothetical protein
MHHNTQLIKINDSFHHCASVASDGNDVLLTAYYGPECTDTQRVFLKYKNAHYDLPFKTGNPVVWYENGKFLLMYSEFMDIDKYGNVPTYPVERWMFCDNHLAEVKIVNDQIILENDHIIKGAFGLLSRCSPIMFNGKSLWPLYREQDPRCEIWTYNGKTLEYLSHFSERDVEQKVVFGSLGDGVAIQPSLIVTKDNKLHAYCRNVTRNLQHAWISTSDDGIEWTELKQSSIPNMNSSLVNIMGTSLFVFNDTPRRERMLLASMKKKMAIVIDVKIISGRDSTGYPNYCWHKDDLIIVHSNRNTIAYHEFSKDYLRMIFGNEL